MALIEKIYYWIESESLSADVDITEQPVEKDINISDHVQRKARTMTVNGIVNGPDASKKIAYLKKWSDKGIIVKYVGRNAFTGIIHGLSTDHDYTVADGAPFSFSITEVQVASSSYVDKLPTPVKAQVAKIVNSGVKQTKNKKNSTKKDKKNTKKKNKKTKVKKTKPKKKNPWEA